MQSILKDNLKIQNGSKELNSQNIHMNHLILLIYKKTIYIYLSNYDNFENIFDNPFGVLNRLLQIGKRDKSLKEKIFVMYKEYRKVPVLSGFDLKLKKQLKFEEPADKDLENLLHQKNKRMSLKDKIKSIISLKNNNQNSLFTVLQKVIKRVNKPFETNESNHLQSEIANSNKQNEIEKKILNVKKQLLKGISFHEEDTQIHQKRLEILKQLKKNEEQFIFFKNNLNDCIMSKSLNDSNIENLVDSFILKSEHLNNIFNMILKPFEETINDFLGKTIQEKFKNNIDSDLNIEFIKGNRSSIYDYNPQNDNLYYFRSLIIVGILTKFSLANNLGQDITVMINHFCKI